MKRRIYLSGSTLKLIAVITMLIDHIAACVIDSSVYPLTYSLMRSIGRIAFPIFCFMIVEGYYHTRDVKKYIARLLIFGFISEIPFDLAMTGSPGLAFGHQNVFFTLALGLLVVWIVDNNKDNVLITYITIIGISALAIILKLDYQCYGIFQILIFYYNRNKRLFRLAGIAFLNILMEQPFGIAALAFIELYNGKKGFNCKYLMYMFYPVHLVCLFFIKINFM